MGRKSGENSALTDKKQKQTKKLHSRCNLPLLRIQTEIETQISIMKDAKRFEFLQIPSLKFWKGEILAVLRIEGTCNNAW